MELYLLKECDPTEKARVELHLSECQGCQKVRSEVVELNKQLVEDMTALESCKQRSKKRTLKAIESADVVIEQPKSLPILRWQWLAVAAVIVFAAVGVLFHVNNQPFEHYFPNNNGFLKAPAGSSVHMIGEREFRLERGELHAHIKTTKSSPEKLTIQTDAATIDVQDTDVEGLVDFKIDIKEANNNKTTSVRVLRGVLKIAGRFVPMGTLMAAGGDVIYLSESRRKQIESLIADIKGDDNQAHKKAVSELIRLEACNEIDSLSKHHDKDIQSAALTVIKTIQLIRRFAFLKETHNKNSDLIESIATSEIKEWALLIGRKLNTTPDLLTVPQKTIIANEILKNKGAVETLHKMRGNEIAILSDERWLYHEALYDKNNNVRESAVWIMFSLIYTLDKEAMAESVRVLLRKFKDENEIAGVRGTSIYAVCQVIWQLDEELFQHVIKIAVSGLEDKLPVARNRCAYLLGCAAGRLKGKPEEEKVVKALKSRLEDSHFDIQLYAAISIAQVASRLDKDLFDKLVNIFVKGLMHEHTEMVGNATNAIKMNEVVGKLDGELLDKVLEAVGFAIKNERMKDLLTHLQSALDTLKRRKQELEKK